MAVVLRTISAFSKKHPVLRGMAVYAVLWPSSNICQQLIQGREQINFAEVGRYSLFGSCYVAPTLFIWIKTAAALFPGHSLGNAIRKAVVEQFLYSPFAISGFYFGMSVLEGRSWDQAVDEVKAKFIPTYKTGVLIWPAVQTINFAFVKERNRVSVTGVVSFFWTVFLSYMKHLENKPKI